MLKSRIPRGSVPFLAVLLAGAIVAGCGSSGSSQSSAGSVSSGAASHATAKGVPTIGINQLVPAPALDEDVAGIKKGLAQRGYVNGKSIHIDIENADGNISLSSTIAQKFVGQHVNVLVSVSTPSGEASAKAIQGTNVPLVFTALTDPVTAKLLTTVSRPSGKNITGVYVPSPVAQQLRLFREIVPSLRSIGVIYDPGEANSVTVVNQLAAVTKAMGIRLVKATVADSDQVEQAADSLVGKVDAMYMPQDNTVNEAVGALIKVEQAHHLPLFTDDAESVASGAIATIGNNDFTMGEQTAALIAQILKGKSAGSLKPVPNSQYGAYVNPKAAAGIGIKIPASILSSAIKES